ncbi:MAG: CoB--CoM heterodisulfide reductase iron-sulfur subunit B family protein [Verrucomicrobia bacterium]|nr:CoB--CoM heterodisulfide reductase iron-sulfur subunit B family protein [Verrucomicrobiota bacterium]
MGLAYTYYPGCSVGATSRWYDISLRAVAKALDVELAELEDWNCCGATAYMSVRELMSFCISARNLALAEPLGRDIVTPCNACFTVLHKTNRYWHEDETLRGKVNEALAAAGLHYKGTVKVRHALDPFVNDVGLDAISEKVTKPLAGLKVAAYYGCQLVRPETGLDSPDYPVILDQLLASLGAEPVDWAMKARCCGASLIVSREDVARDLIADILKCAADAGAEAITTLCPMCHINLETQMARINKDYGFDLNFPVLFFTQLMGVALGVDETELGLDKGFIDARPLLTRHGIGARA